MDMDPSSYLDVLIEHAPKVVGVLLALFVAWIIANWTERAVRAGLEKRNFDATLTRFFAKLGRYLILIGAVLGCLGVFGIQTASFAAVLAAANPACDIRDDECKSALTIGIVSAARSHRKIIASTPGCTTVRIVPPLLRVVAEPLRSHRFAQRLASLALLGRDGTAPGMALGVEAVVSRPHVDAVVGRTIFGRGGARAILASRIE